MSAMNGWSHLLAPVPVETFLSQFWEPQKPLHIPGPQTKFDLLCDRDSFTQSILTTKSDKLQLRVAYGDADDGGYAYGYFGGREALEHFDRGATICVTAIEHVHAGVREFRDVLAAQWPSPDPLIVNCYYSPDGQGFSTHYDPQSVWVLQIAGRKRWFVSKQRAVAFPREGLTTMELRQRGSTLPESAADMMAVDMTPGDVLYLPPGTWHRAEADGFSLALSISQVNEGTRRLVSRVLRTALLDRPEWRRHFPLPVSGSASVGQHLETLLAEMKAAVARLTVTDLRDAWAGMCLPRTEVSAAMPVHATDPVRVVNPLAAFADEASSTVVVYRNQQRYALPWLCRFLLNRDAEPFAAAEIAAHLNESWERSLPLVLDLLQIGVLTRA